MIYKTVYMEPGMEVPEEKVFEFEDYKDLQKMVDGPVEFIEVNINGYFYDIILHEEGKVIGLQPTLALAQDRAIYDLIVGKIIFLKADSEGRTLSLNDEDIERIINYFGQSNMRCFYNDLSIPVYDSFQ